MTPFHRHSAGGVHIGRIAGIGALTLALLGGAAYAGGQVLTGGPAGSSKAAASADGSRVTGDGVTTPDASPATVEPLPSSATPGSAAPTPTTAAPTPTQATVTPKPTPTKSKPKTPPPSPPPGTSGEASEVLRIVNDERGKAGCGAMTIDSRLTLSAQRHSEDQVAHNYFSHTGRNGSSMGQRIEDAGYKPWSGLAENIAKGQRTPAEVMESWMNSSGHRANIVNCGYKHIGIGIAGSGGSKVWTQNFGSPGR